MNNTVEGGRFTPALVPPEATLVRKHAGEIRVVAANCHARRCEGSAGVRIGPGSAAVRRLENQVGVIVGKTATAFIHARDVQIAVGHVTRDLHVANEGILSADHDCAAPGVAVVSGAGNENVRIGSTKVVPGNVHIPEVWRTWVVIRPARLAVVAAVGMHAEMGPAIWILGSSGFISAQRTASVAVEPDCEPRLRRPVIQNNRVAKGVGERTLTTGGGDTGKGQAAVGRTRYTRE